MRKRPTKHRVKPERDRLVFDIIHDLAGIPATKLAQRSWISAQTIRNARRGPKHGGTRYPHGVTLQELARLAGGEIQYRPRVNRPEED